MRLLDRYIFRQVSLAFLLCLTVLTLLIWLIAALRDFNLITAQGQSILVFATISSLALPSLVVIIAPVALFVAIVWALNRLNSDSELVVMNASGWSPGRLILPFAVLTSLVALGTGALTIYGQPASQHELRYWLTKVSADVISKIVREGQFTTVQGGITFHVRERRPNGALLGIFVQDARAKDQSLTYIAERGQVIETKGQPSPTEGGVATSDGLFLILEKGSVQRESSGSSSDSSIVAFEHYAIDLSQLIDDADVTHFKPRERYTSELLGFDPTAPGNAGEAGRVRSELVERFVAPLYPVAFMFVALAALGQARTTRQSRASALNIAIAAIIALRIVGFFMTQSLSVRSIAGAVAGFAVPIGVCLFCALIIFGVIRPRLPRPVAALGERAAALAQRLRPQPVGGASGS